MKYRIREIEAGDDAQIEQVIRQCLIEFGGNREGTAWSDPQLGSLHSAYGREDEGYWIGEDERGRILGGVGIAGIPGCEGVCELQKMYCIPEVRGSTVAKDLLCTALRFGERFYRQCYLETLENMVRAQIFYEKNGFVRTERIMGDTGHFRCDVRYIRKLSCKKANS